MRDPFGWDLPPGVTTADIDRAFGGDPLFEALCERLPPACPSCGATTDALPGQPRHDEYPDELAAHVTAYTYCTGGMVARCDAARYPDSDDPDDSDVPCERILAEFACGCRECRGEDARDEH